MSCHAAEKDVVQPNFSPALPISKLHEMYGHSSTGAPVLGHLLGRMSAGKSSIQAFGPTISTVFFAQRQFILSSRVQRGQGYTSHCELLDTIGIYLHYCRSKSSACFHRECLHLIMSSQGPMSFIIPAG